jgi:hypothetical protein
MFLQVTSVTSKSPRLRVIEMGIASIDWEIGMGKGAPGAVEWVAVPVLAASESDIYVNLRVGGSNL